jgi:hemoglobin
LPAWSDQNYILVITREIAFVAPVAFTDLDRRSAVHDLVVGFYREVVFDELLGPVFAEVAEVDWSVHIPKLIDYWCRILLGEPGYDGNLLGAHRHLHALQPLRGEHFDRWYSLWVDTVDARWRGPGADRAKSHAARIGATLHRQLLAGEWTPAPDGARAVSPAHDRT